MFYWLFYFIFVILGFGVGPLGVKFCIYTMLSTPLEFRSSRDDGLEFLCILLGIIYTTILVARRIKNLKNYWWLPVISIVGFFSFLPGLLLSYLLHTIFWVLDPSMAL